MKVDDKPKAFTLKVRRFRDAAEKSWWQGIEVPVFAETMSVLDALIWAQSNTDSTLAFRCACRVGMCGSCGMVIGGRERLACRTLVRTLVSRANTQITVQPLRHLPVVRDLVTNPAPFFDKYRKVMPYLVSHGRSDHELAVISPASRERRQIDPQRECISCGLCYSACTVAGMSEGFLGPAALNRMYALVADSRDGAASHRLRIVAGEDGLWRCHSLFECTAVCPKGISPTVAIQRLKGMAIAHRFRALLRLRG